MPDQPPERPKGAAILTAAEFEDAVSPVVPKLRATARRLTGNPIDGEDLVQDTLLRAWHARVMFEPGTNLNAWLFRIQRNQFLTGLRRARPWVDLDARVADTLSAERPMQEGYLAEVDMERALMALPPHHRAAVLSVSAGESYSDAADRLSISVNTLKSRVNRARTGLRAAMSTGSEPRSSVATLTRTLKLDSPIAQRRAGKRNAIYETWKMSGSKMIG